MDWKIVKQGITFDDVLLVPCESKILPKEVSIRTRFTRNVELNIPISSAAMDTVTESEMAIALAQEGGIGIIHRNLSVEEQVREVVKVKRSANGIIVDPITLSPEESVSKARQIMEEHHISGLPITVNGKLVGILTSRDLHFYRGQDVKISGIMTKENLVTAPVGTTLEEAKDILHQNKVEKLLIVDERRNLKGLITIKDINKLIAFPHASRDELGRLRVGAAVGVRDDERVEALIKSGVDLVVIDTAHGHSKNVIDAVTRLKKKFDIELVAGNVATKEGAEAIISAGVDGVKVGIGSGAVCTTRVIAGVGVPQMTAIFDCSEAAKKAKVPVIADGGIRLSGDIIKALAAGASSVMIGALFAGLDESPGETILYKGRSYKSFRGMGSTGAMMKGSSDRYFQEGILERDKLVAEGVEGMVPYKGSLSSFLYQLAGGLRAGMGYCGASTIVELQEKSRFIMVTPAGQRESHPHDVAITKEEPNYSIE